MLGDPIAYSRSARLSGLSCPIGHQGRPQFLKPSFCHGSLHGCRNLHGCLVISDAQILKCPKYLRCFYVVIKGLLFTTRALCPNFLANSKFFLS